MKKTLKILFVFFEEKKRGNPLEFYTFSIEMNERISQLRILVATEYLPPYVSGIANRCKNLIHGYKESGAKVTVCSVSGTDCDMSGISIPNIFYSEQRYVVECHFKRV